MICYMFFRYLSIHNRNLFFAVLHLVFAYFPLSYFLNAFLKPEPDVNSLQEINLDERQVQVQVFTADHGRELLFLR